MFVAPFLCTERNCVCLLMEMFTFCREGQYSLRVMSAGPPHPLWELKPVLKGRWEEVAIGACTVAIGAAICQFLSSQSASAGHREGVSVLLGLSVLCTAYSLNELSMRI